MDEIKLGIAQHKGVRAQELLDNQLLNEAFAEIEDRYMVVWRSTKPEDFNNREEAWRAIKTLEQIRRLLKRYVEDGKIAASDLKRASEEYERKRRNPK